ncbi:DUF2726 domain-containing protein [Frigidibacter sp. MR17.14]|uniref:DUF2726 domain-containing protein n=1 Tax=Frigidibacter sp. MR17.14 TaxID=3126509 RepID=UPI0030130EAE
MPSAPAGDGAALLLLGLLVAGLLVAALIMGQRRGGRGGARRNHRSRDVQMPQSVWRRPDARTLSQPELYTPPAPGGLPPARDLVHEHLAAVAVIRFERKRLLNKSEARLLPVIEDEVAKLPRGHRVMAQVSLGEILRPVPDEGSEDERRVAFNAINAKRLDFAVFDPGGWLVLAIEYQGHGHYHEISFLRDAVKREALRKAGVAFLEVPADTTPDALRDLLRQHLTPRAPLRSAGA